MQKILATIAEDECLDLTYHRRVRGGNDNRVTNKSSHINLDMPSGMIWAIVITHYPKIYEEKNNIRAQCRRMADDLPPANRSQLYGDCAAHPRRPSGLVSEKV